MPHNWSHFWSHFFSQFFLFRALLAKPNWLLMDESTSALDEPMEAAIFYSIRSLLPNSTIVSIGHR